MVANGNFSFAYKAPRGIASTCKCWSCNPKVLFLPQDRNTKPSERRHKFNENCLLRNVMQNYPYYITDTLTKYYQRFWVTTYAPLNAPLIYGQKILGGNAVYFRFQVLDSRPPVRGIWIPNSEFQSFEGFWTPRPRIPDSGIRITFRGAIQSKEHRTLNI